MSNTEKSEYRQLLRQQTILARFGELALRSDDLDEILTEGCRLVGEALGTDLAKVVELQDDGKTLRVRAGVGWKPGVVGVATITVADDTSEGVALKTGEPMISPDIQSESRFRYPPFLVENGVRAVANVIIIGGKDRPPFGILQVDSRDPRQFTDNDTTFLSGYANLIAAAVDRFRIIGDLRKSEAQLRHTQKLEAIGRLAAGVAHDFNNILQGISSGLELVLDDATPGTPMEEYAEMALTSAKRGSSLTHHLLSYARRQMLQPKQIDLAAFLSELRQLLSRTLGPHIMIKVQADPYLPRVYVDSGQLQTALLNIAINASHAMPGGGVLTLGAHEDAAAGPRSVVITLSDTGSGMDEATLAQAFEPFFSTKGLEGSGLGLSMVQGFAEQSGGKVRIESTLGLGTKIELWLPAILGTNFSGEQQRASGKLTGSGRVLLVDDEADVLVMTGTLLERAGFQVVRAHSADRALATLAASERFDALVTDYAMRDMNGVDLITRARTFQPELPAVIITGFAHVDTADALPKDVTVVHKPFPRGELVRVLVQSISRQPTSTQAK